MLKKIILFLLLMSIQTISNAKIDLNGAIRNDSLWLVNGRTSSFINILENKLVMQRNAKQWKFYSDLRFDLYTSELLGDDLSSIDLIQVDLLRAFIKYYAAYGDITVGKTYVNFGNIGVFNPFELDRGMNFSDLNYTKSGIVALAYDCFINDLSGAKLFVSPDNQTTAFGGTLYTNLSPFDIGVVINHLDKNNNSAGIYFKGDLEIGVQGSLAYHFDDAGKNDFAEIVLGVDYSFFDGKLVTGCQGYYNGQNVENNYSGRGVLQYAPTSDAFSDKFYLYADLAYHYDEFTGYQLDAFVNLQDHSSLIIPTANYTLADGLTLTGQLMIPTGAGKSQYSRDLYGDVIVVLRVEAKL